MAWTIPRTWVTGEVVTAALLNLHLRDNVDQAFRPFLKQAGLSNVAVIASSTSASASTSASMTPPVSGRLFWTVTYFCRFTVAGSMVVNVDPLLNAVGGTYTAGNGNTQTVNASNQTTGYSDVVGGTTYTINLRAFTGAGTGTVAIDNATVTFQYGTLMP